MRLIEYIRSKVHSTWYKIGRKPPQQESRFMIDIDITSNEYNPEISSEEIPEDSDFLSNRSLQLNKKKVLVVEDSDDSRDLICVLLRRAGANVDSASNGKDGLKKALEQQPDLILLDLEMPILDGFGVIKQLRSKDYKKPVLAITAHNNIEDRDRCAEAGFDGHISKPFNSERLLQVLKEHLASV